MQDIKPDTSLYTSIPDKLRAMALIFESDQEVQVFTANKWVAADKSNSPQNRINFMLNTSADYRIKPKLRELWVTYDGMGRRKYVTSDEMAAIGEADDKEDWTIVRFVEQPE